MVGESPMSSSKKKKKTQSSLWIFSLWVIVVISTWLFSMLGSGAALENSVGLKQLFSIRGPISPPDDVLMITHNEETPWILGGEHLQSISRDLYAEVIDRLVDYGASYIVFDVSFRNPGEQDSNHQLSQSIAKAGNVILFQYMQPLDPHHFEVQGQDAHAIRRGNTLQIQGEQSIAPLAPFRDQALATASFMLPQQQPIYALSLFHQGLGHEEPLLPLVAYQVYQKTQFMALFNDYQDFYLSRKNRDLPHLSSAAIEQLKNLLRSDQHLVFAQTFRRWLQRYDHFYRRMASLAKTVGLHRLMHVYGSDQPHMMNFYGGSGTIPDITFQELLMAGEQQKQVLREIIQGKVIFIGFSKLNKSYSRDDFETLMSSPGNARTSGVEIAATVFANLLDQSQLSTFVAWHQLIYYFVLSLVFWYILKAPSLYRRFLQGGLLVIGYGIICYQLFAHWSFWLPWLVPLLLLMPAMLLLQLMMFNHKQSQALSISEAYLSNYAPTDLAKAIEPQGDLLLQENHSTYCICLMTDLQGFTSLAEGRDPQQIHQKLNEYYQIIIREIEAFGGRVTNIAGDGLLAVWVGSSLTELPKQKACEAALSILQSMDGFDFGQQDYLKTCIGVHCGELSMGNLGANGRFLSFGPVGDTVNTAARIESYNRILNTQLLISDVMRRGLKGVRCSYRDSVFFKGKRQAVKLYEVIETT